MTDPYDDGWPDAERTMMGTNYGYPIEDEEVD